jgi:undecaprenyl-diphosphatase
MTRSGYRKRTIGLLIALLLIRFWFGQTFELSGHEAYLWVQGHGANLASGYWEQGPLVPWITRIGTLFFGDTELGVRWPAAWICVASAFVLFYLARHWFNAQAAFWTVVLFILVPMYAWKFSFMSEAAVSTGLMALAMISFCLAVEHNYLRWWLLGGAACGLALLVTLSNFWWLVGILIYFAGHPGRRPRLRDWRLLGAVVFASLFVIPIIWWWLGPQVADVARTRILNAMPLSHPFSFNQGFHFIGQEIFSICPLFFVLIVWVLWRLGPLLWKDNRYALLICLAIPGLIWQNFSAFFREGFLETIPALCLPLVLLTGCYLARLAQIDRRIAMVCGFALVVIGVQTFAGLNPYYIASGPDGHGIKLKRSVSGENIGRFDDAKRQESWRYLADAVQIMQRDLGITLIMTDTPETASALTFYLPRNPKVYVQSRPNHITQYDFWADYDQEATPNDSMLYIGHSSDPARRTDPPSGLVEKEFSSVQSIEDGPLPDLDKSWNFWKCETFIGTSTPGKDIDNSPMQDRDALPK